MEIKLNITEHNVLQRIAERVQGIALTEEQIIEAALEALRQDTRVRQVIKEHLKKHPRTSEIVSKL